MRSLSDNFRKSFKNLSKKAKKVRPEVWLLLIIIFALALRYKTFVGVCCDDDLSYTLIGNQILKGDFKPNDWIFSVRPVINYPIAFFFYLFGINDFSATLFVLMTSIGSIVLCYYFGKYFFDELTGLIGAFLISFYPLNVIYSTHIVPDIPLGVFMGLSVLLFLMGEKRGNLLYYFLGGLSAALAYLVKGIGVLIFLFIISYYLLNKIVNFKISKPSKIKKPKKRSDIGLIIFITGFVLILAIEGIFYFYQTGDFLHHYNVESSYYSTPGLGYNFNLKFYPNAIFNLKNPHPYFGYFYFLGAASILYIVLKKSRAAAVFALWFLSLFLYLEFGVMNIINFFPIHKLYRFLEIITIPLIVMISYMLARKSKPVLNFLKILVIVFLLFVSINSVTKESNYLNNQYLSDFREIAKFLEEHKSEKFFVDQSTYQYLKFYSKYKTSNLYLLEYADKSKINNSFILINCSRGIIENREMRSRIDDYLLTPKENWKLIKTIESADKGIYATYNPKIYYVP